MTLPLCSLCSLEPFKSPGVLPALTTTCLIVCCELPGPDRALGCCLTAPELRNGPVGPNLKLNPGLTSVTAAAAGVSVYIVGEKKPHSASSLKYLTVFVDFTRTVETEPADFLLYNGKPRKSLICAVVLP